MTVLVSMLVLSPASATTLQVGPTAPYTTISAAISAAASGDVIEVAPGTYAERLYVSKSLEIVGTGGSGSTTISDASSSVVSVNGQTLRLTGFTVTGGADRGLYVRNAADVTLSDVVVTGVGSARPGGGLYLAGGSAARGDGVVFTGNTGTYGGHVYVSGSQLELTGSTLSLGSGTHGGAIYATGGSTVLLDGCTLADNEATGASPSRGGAVRAYESDLTILGSTFDGGTADSGGQISVSNGMLDVSQTLLAAGTASDGGAITVSNAVVAMTDVDVQLGVASRLGGCVVAWSSDLFLDTVRLEDCAVTDPSGYGGALYTYGTGDLVLSGGHVVRSSAWAGGGVRISDDAAATIDGVRFEANQATYGGAIHAGAVELTLRDSTFLGNTAYDGGAIRWARAAPSTLTVEGTAFEGNVATDVGGALYLHDAGAADIDDSTFTGNGARIGGGIFANTLDTLAVRRGLFCANGAEDGGGASTTAIATSERWTNNVFAENVAQDDGGALDLAGGAGTEVAFNHFLANDAASGAVRAIGDLRFVDNAIAYTPAGSGLHTALDLPPAQVDRNVWFDNVADHLGGAQTGWGADNLVADPALQDVTLDGDCTNDVYWPSLSSELVDRGDPALVDPDGTRADRGAYGGPEADPYPFQDADLDGWILMWDCDDTDPGVRPGAADPSGDGIDANCDGQDGCDVDGDGFEAAGCGGPDCADTDPARYPDATEVAADALDSDCDGLDDPRPPPVPFEITLENPTGATWRGGVLAVMPEGAPLNALLEVGRAPLQGDPYDTYTFGHETCDPAGEDDGDGPLLDNRWPALASGADLWHVGDLGPGTAATVAFEARPGDVLSFVARVDGEVDDVVMMHQAGDPSDTTVTLFNDLGMPLWWPRFDLGGYDLNSTARDDGTASDCARSCPVAGGCWVAPDNDSVGLDAGGVVALPVPDELQRWDSFLIEAVPGTITENGVGSPAVLYRKLHGDWVMVFETMTGSDPACPGGLWSLGLATSTDGWNWTVQPAPVVAPTAGTYSRCVAAHPAVVLDDDGSRVHLYFKAEQGDDACAVSTPAWGCDRYTGVGYALLGGDLSVQSTSPEPVLAMAGATFGFPSVARVDGAWEMVLQQFPDLVHASATAPEGPFTLDPTPILQTGQFPWSQTELYNPALVCEGDTLPQPTYPWWMLYGGRTRATTWGPVTDGGLAEAIGSSITSWFTGVTPVQYSSDDEWRHWDVVRVGGERLVYFTERDTAGRNRVGVAATEDQLYRADVATRLCAQPSWW